MTKAREKRGRMTERAAKKKRSRKCKKRERKPWDKLRIKFWEYTRNKLCT
jgi:hypothetical protein